MEKLLGEVLNKEQYLDVPEEISNLSNSIKAKHFFEETIGIDNIFVAPVLVKITSLKCSNLLCWAAIREDFKEVLRLATIFNTDMSHIKNCAIKSIELLDKEYYYIWNGQFYCVIGTTTGEVVLKKVYGVWSEADVRNFMKIKDPDAVAPDIFPVELFSISGHNFICSAWAVACEDVVYWYPVQWDDYDKLQKYGNKDINMLPINVGDVTRAGNINFEILYNEALGLYFEKTDKKLSWHHLLNQEDSEPLSSEKGKTIKLELPSNLKKHQKSKDGKTLTLSLNSRKN